MGNGSWIKDAEGVCEICEHPNCDGSCERQMDAFLIKAGLIGALVLCLAGLLRLIVF